MTERNGNGFKAWLLVIAGAVIVMLMGLVGALVKSAWTDMVNMHVQIIERLQKLESKRGDR